MGSFILSLYSVFEIASIVILITASIYFIVPTYDKRVSFHEAKFAEGRFRNAFMGTWKEPPEKNGEKCVVKNRKASCCWSLNDWDMTLKIVRKAQELSAAFNDISRTSRPINFLDLDVLKVVEKSDPQAPLQYVKPNEWVTVEKYLEGQFEKWCNNYGFISKASISLPAFMHWSWVHSKGEVMVADLQGVRGDKSYSLTDPVIMSLKCEYGATDTGVEGMVMFFMQHECNVFCKDLKRPQPNDFLNHPQLPRNEVQACIENITQMGNSTTYKYELKFRAELKQVVVQILKSHFES